MDNSFVDIEEEIKEEAKNDEVREDDDYLFV